MEGGGEGYLVRVPVREHLPQRGPGVLRRGPWRRAPPPPRSHPPPGPAPAPRPPPPPAMQQRLSSAPSYFTHIASGGSGPVSILCGGGGREAPWPRGPGPAPLAGDLEGARGQGSCSARPGRGRAGGGDRRQPRAPAAPRAPRAAGPCSPNARGRRCRPGAAPRHFAGWALPPWIGGGLGDGHCPHLGRRRPRCARPVPR